MKKILFILLLTLGMGASWGQTTIAVENFDSATKTWNYTTDASRYSYSNKYNGVKSLGLRGTSTAAKEVTFDNVDISGYTDVTLSVAYASYKVDSGEDLIMYIYYDGHTSSDVSKKLIDGNSNYSLNINTTGSASRTPQGANPYTFNVPAGHTSIKVKFIGWYIESGEYYYVDDVELKGTPANDTDTDVYNTNAQPASTTISSLVDTDGDAIEVFEMEIQDQGSGDNLPTKVTNIRLKPHTTNSADWTNNIQGFVVYDAGGNTYTPTVTITDSAIDFAFGVGDLNIADGGTIDLYFDIYLNTSNLEDSKVLSFMVDADDHGFTADSSGSTFAATFSGDFNSNDFTIGVVATEMQFTQQPTDVAGGAVMSPAVTVAYTDANGNVDVDADGVGVTAILSATGATLSTSTTTDGTAVQGVMTFSDIKFVTAGNGVTLTVTDNGTVLTNGDNVVSDTFDVTGAPEISVEGNSTEITSGDTTPDTTDHTDFGEVNYQNGATVTRTFTIKNTGNVNLELDGSPIVSISGTNATDFSITQPSNSTIAAGSSTTFSITFDPSADGVRTATISIDNTDSNEDPYTFDIQGTGYTPCTQLFISEYAEKDGGNYIEIYNPTDSDVDMSNFQVWRALNGGAWSGAGTTDIISLSGTLASGNVYVVARDPADIPFANKYDPDLDYNGDDNIGLAWNGGSGSTFTLIDAVGDDNGDPGTGWTVAGVSNATLNHTLVRKSSVDYPNTDWIASAGTNASDSEWIVLDYTITTQLYHVSDCQQIPLMAVVGHLPGAGNDELVIDELLAGPQTPKASNNTLFEDRQVGVTTVSHTFRIYNAGNTALNLTGNPIVDITGTNATDFSVTSQASTPVAANNGYTDFVIEFNPSDYGVRTATVSIANDNPFENPYVFTIQGTGVNYTPCPTQDLIFTDDFEDNLDDWVVTNDADPNANVVISNVFNGANSTTNAALFDAPNAPNTYYVSSIEKTFANSNNLVLDFNYYFEDYRGGQITVYLNNVVVYNIYTESDHNNGTDLKITNSTDDTWHSIHLDLSSNTSVNQDYTIKIAGESKTKNTSGWKDRVVLDELTLTGVTVLSTTTWNGSAWSNGAPALTVKAIIDGNYDITNANIHTCECQVKSGKFLTISDGHSLLVETNIVNDGTILVNNEGSLVQHKSDAIITGSGTYQLNKTSLPLNNYYDYIYWSSPLNSTSFTLGDIVTDAWRYYEFDLTQTAPGWHQLTAGDTPVKGMGYAISAPNGTNSAITLSPQFVKENDPFNNGNIIVNIYKKGSAAGDPLNYNLLGNPYPSAIDFNALVNDPDNTSVNGSYYLWTNCAGLNGNNHQESGYTVYASSGTATAACNDSNNPTAGQYIATAQGFFVEANTDDSTLTFKNKHRVTDNNNNFVNRPNNNHQVAWLNMTDDTGHFNQIAVGFYPDATAGFDRLFDAHTMNDGSDFALYAVSGVHKLTIDALPDTNISGTRVPLTIEVTAASNLTISLDHQTGLDDFDIYLFDNNTQNTIDLKAGNYTFNLPAGVYDGRFELVFNSVTGIEDENLPEEAIILSQQHGIFTLQSILDNEQIQDLNVYDINGRTLFTKTDLNSPKTQVNLSHLPNGSIVLFKIMTSGQKTTVKKAVKLK